MATTARKLLSFAPDYGYDEEVRSTDTVQLPNVVLAGTFDANGQVLTGLPEPVNPSDAATKKYADNLASGIDAIDSCKALANSNVASLSGPATIDGISLVAGDRVLLIAQSDASKNGVWVVQSATWTRPGDFAAGLGASGKHTFISDEGPTAGNYTSTGWVCSSAKGADIVGTNALSFVQFSGLGEVTAGSGLIKSATNGNTISIALATNPGLQFTTGQLDHLLQPSGSLTKDASGLGIQLNGATLNNSGTGLRVLGVPALFTVAGNAVDANVTASNLNTLVDGPTVQADGLHTHLSVLRSQAVVDTHTNGSAALNVGDPVYWSATANTLAKGDASSSASANIIGIVGGAVAANASAGVWKYGVLKNAGTGFTPGGQVFLAVGGGLTQQVPTAPGSVIISCGVACSTSDIDVAVKFIGRRAST